MNTGKPRNHIVIIDGTQSRLSDGKETNAGLLYKLLGEVKDRREETLWYHPGIQGRGLWKWVVLASGLGINRTIRDAYAHLSSNYKDGDKIYLFGYSRGAYAVRSLAGMIDRIGLLRKDKAIERNIRQAFRLYECEDTESVMKAFFDTNCHRDIDIEMIGVWDTVKALGIEYPILSRLAPMATEFHNDRISDHVKNGFHALAIDETRTAYTPVIWHTAPEWPGHLEQVWFRGAHSDVGGHIWRYPQARPLANIPLVWMLERAHKCGVKLPTDWKTRFPQDIQAPPQGSKRGIARFFLFRKPRNIGGCPSEYIHPTVLEHEPEFTASVPVQKNE